MKKDRITLDQALGMLEDRDDLPDVLFSFVTALDDRVRRMVHVRRREDAPAVQYDVFEVLDLGVDEICLIICASRNSCSAVEYVCRGVVFVVELHNALF